MFSYTLLLRIIDNASSKCFITVFVFILAISLLYVFHALLREKKYEIVVYCLTIIIVVVYCSIEYGVNDDDRTVLKLVCIKILKSDF